MHNHYQNDAHYLLVIYVPSTHINIVKEALWGEKAGCIGNYDRCSWQTLGQGSFRPLPGSTPFVGEVSTDTLIDEYRLEMVCLGQHLTRAIEALRLAHPYETPAYSVTPTL